MITRIALVGASSTGKTTVYELLKNKLPKYEFVNESTRTVGGYGFPINEKGTDATQLAISSFHLEALLQPYNLVLDRCYMDVVVYSKFMENLRARTYNYIEDQQLEAIYEAVKALNDVDKAIVFLYLEDKSYKEISETIGLTEVNARVKMNRIKNKLKKQLNP